MGNWEKAAVSIKVVSTLGRQSFCKAIFYFVCFKGFKKMM